MAKKYDYQMKVITIDEAMELLGYNDLVRFVGDVDKYLPTLSIPDSTVDMYSMSEITAMATSLGKEVSIPDEIKNRCIVEEIEKKHEIPEEHAVQKRLEHPYMEGSKCLENCSHRDEYGFCKNGDNCIKYGINYVTERPLNEPRVEVNSYPPTDSQRVTLMDIQNVLGAQIMALADPNLTDVQREAVSKNALTIASVSKTFMNGIDLSLRSYGLMAVKGVDKNKVRRLIE